jgi:hypothetical protein
VANIYARKARIFIHNEGKVLTILSSIFVPVTTWKFQEQAEEKKNPNVKSGLSGIFHDYLE